MINFNVINFSVKNLSISYGQHLLFSPLNFQLISGEMLLIQGVNGSGKSSLLKLLCGFLKQDCGEIFFQGQPIHSSLFDYRQNLYYLGHSNGLKLDLTVLENIQLACNLHLGTQLLPNVPSIDLYLSQFKLASFRETKTRLLSAGQKRRLALLNCCLTKKPIWILDEPLTSLDTESQNFFSTQLNSHLKSGGIALVSSHGQFLKATHHLELKAC